MTNSEAYRMIGARAEELSKLPEVQAKMIEMVRNGSTKEDTEKWLYMCAVGTLIGLQK